MLWINNNYSNELFKTPVMSHSKEKNMCKETRFKNDENSNGKLDRLVYYKLYATAF